MKTLVTAALLLALVSPVAARDYEIWDCGNGVEVTATPKTMGVVLEDQKNPLKGKFTLQWNFYDGDQGSVTLNGKVCELITARVEAYRECAKGSRDDCEELKRGWEPDLTKAEKKAIERSAQQH